MIQLIADAEWIFSSLSLSPGAAMRPLIQSGFDKNKDSSYSEPLRPMTQSVLEEEGREWSSRSDLFFSHLWDQRRTILGPSVPQHSLASALPPLITSLCKVTLRWIFLKKFKWHL